MTTRTRINIREMSPMRMLFSILYDSLIILSFVILLSFPIVIINHGHAIPSKDKLYPLYIISISYTYFWLMIKLSGQTIGMKVWRFRYEKSRSKYLGLSLLMRFCLFLPVSLLCFFQAKKRELILKKYCGISKYSLENSK